jgi:hypothetical protein
MKMMKTTNTCLNICPYTDCNIGIEIIEINCAIFRCGIYKDSNTQINPHLSKDECDALKKEDKIWGCGRPFQLVTKDGNCTLIQCDYI